MNIEQQKQIKQAHRPRIKKGDEVIVITGADKGKTGRVLEVLPKVRRVLVEGVRVAQRSYKKGTNPNLPQGGIHKKEMPIDISNVMLVGPKDGKPSRIGVRYDTNKDGGKVRVRFAKGSGTAKGTTTDLKD